jgi:hypothetical protein
MPNCQKTSILEYITFIDICQAKRRCIQYFSYRCLICLILMTRTSQNHSPITFKNPLQTPRISVPDSTTPHYLEIRLPSDFLYKIKSLISQGPFMFVDI